MMIGYRNRAVPVDVDECAIVPPRSMKRSMPILVVAVLSGVGWTIGCHEPTGPKTIDNPDPTVKIPAIKEAVQSDDKAAISELVKNLSSDDPAIRFYAIQGLQRLTGKDFGYKYYDEPELRKPAVKQWQDWLAEQKH